MLELRRRQFLTLLSGAATWPLAARAQQPAMQVGGRVHHSPKRGGFKAEKLSR